MTAPPQSCRSRPRISGQSRSSRWDLARRSPTLRRPEGRIPSRRPAVVPGALRSTMNEKDDRILPCGIELRRLQEPVLNLLPPVSSTVRSRALEVDVLQPVGVFVRQGVTFRSADTKRTPQAPSASISSNRNVSRPGDEMDPAMVTRCGTPPQSGPDRGCPCRDRPR